MKSRKEGSLPSTLNRDFSQKQIGSKRPLEVSTKHLDVLPEDESQNRTESMRYCSSEQISSIDHKAQTKLK